MKVATKILCFDGGILSLPKQKKDSVNLIAEKKGCECIIMRVTNDFSHFQGT